MERESRASTGLGKVSILVATVRYNNGFHEVIFRTAETGLPYPDGKEHWVHGTWFFDAQASYHFAFPAAVEGPSLAGWKKWLNETSIAIGCNDVFGQDPPKAYGADFTNSYSYPALIYDGTGRFVYVTLKKNSNAAYQN